jgi:hypothetical protein
MSTAARETAALLAVGSPGSPWFGPRVFEDAARCPAKAAVTLRGYELPARSRGEPLAKLTGGAWLATARLLEELARRGPTSAYMAGQHPVIHLGRFAASLLTQEGRAVREFAVDAAEALLDAQAVTAGAFDYYPAFIKMLFGSGQMHAGGVFAFRGPAGEWQIWRLRMTTARPASDMSRGWAVTGAYCLAGHLDYEADDPLQAVQAFEVGAAGGFVEPIARWTRAELDAEFAALRSGVLRNMAGDLRVRAGSHCAGCAFVGNCPAAPRVEGLLQLVPRQPTVRKVTATDLRTHADCARRYQLLALQGLPGDALTGEALLRGQSLDIWLHANHMRGTACTEADVHRFLAETTDQLGAAMARHHLGICPLADVEASSGTLVAQKEVAALDAGSRILLVARPDAIYHRQGAVVWRETKTRTILTPRAARQLIETDVAAALYLALLASGASGPPDALEWEELSADGHELTVLLADDNDLVEAARAHVSAAVADLLSDSAFVPRIGAGCAECPVRRWCPDAP